MPFCVRTFGTKFACSQHITFCMQSDSLSSEEESELTTDFNDMSLDSEDFTREVKIKQIIFF
jgi:hypothetical protein